MAYSGIVLSELIAGGLNSSFIRRSLQFAFQFLMEADIAERCQAERGRHASARANSRNGHRHTLYETCVGELDLKIPKLRYGVYAPAFLDKRGLVERALISVIHASFFSAATIQSIEELNSALTAMGVSTRSIPSLCAELNARIKESLLAEYSRKAGFVCAPN
jgi:transposase-like protein